MRLKRLFFLLSALLAFTVWTGAVGTPIPPAPTQWVTDAGAVLSPGTLDALNGRLEAFERATGDQVIVYIGTTTGGVPIDDWAVKAFAAWRIGQKGKDNGVALFVFPQDKSLHIEVGYGLEGQLPDATAWLIIHDAMLPKLKAGDYDGAVTAGVQGILGTLGGAQWKEPITAAAVSQSARAARGSGQPAGLTIWQMILGGLLLIGFLFLLVTHPTLAIFLLFQILSGAGGGGFGGGGGGFSGGGGRSGGGGASGSW
ncbi:MAG: TPM domain-containing protein [Acidobacteriota bacterium]